MTPAELLDSWLLTRLPAQATGWLAERVAGAEKQGADAAFLLAFSTAPRRTGRADLRLGPEELAAVASARPGLRPELWTLDQAARTRLVLALPSDAEGYVATLDRLFADAELGELVALYGALPLLPHPEAHRARAAEGVRSNMKAVFEAVALRNPYPAEALEDDAWNQLVLKCLFLGSPLGLVEGIDGRVNTKLASMLSDFAHERWAAGRPVSPELWRCLGPQAEGPLLDDLERALREGTDRERAGVALSSRDNPRAAALLQGHRESVARALSAYPSWDAIARGAAVTS
jgi:hypothetical protein